MRYSAMRAIHKEDSLSNDAPDPQPDALVRLNDAGVVEVFDGTSWREYGVLPHADPGAVVRLEPFDETLPEGPGR